MKKLLQAAIEELVQETKPQAEQPKNENAKREDEIVFYAVMKNPEGLKLASDKESHEQWELRKRRGRVRVRKTSKGDLNPTYTLTFKTKSENAGIMGSIEEEYPCEEGMFKSFKNLSDQGMVKDRYLFPVKSVQITTEAGKQDVHVEDVFYEVDVFFNEDGTYNENIKIDLEVNKILDAINKAKPDLGNFNLNVKILDLPFQPTSVIISDKNTSEEDKAKITKLYDDVFLTKLSDLKTGNEGIFDSLTNFISRTFTSEEKIRNFLSNLDYTKIKNQSIIKTPQWSGIFNSNSSTIECNDIITLLDDFIRTRSSNLNMVNFNIAEINKLLPDLKKMQDDEIYSKVSIFIEKLKNRNNGFFDESSSKINLDEKQNLKDIKTANENEIKKLVVKLLELLKEDKVLITKLKELDELELKFYRFSYDYIDQDTEQSLYDVAVEIFNVSYFIHDKIRSELKYRSKIIHGCYKYIKACID